MSHNDSGPAFYGAGVLRPPRIDRLHSESAPHCGVCGVEYRAVTFWRSSDSAGTRDMRGYEPRCECWRAGYNATTGESSPGQTHYEGCWRNHGHHVCAIEVAEMYEAMVAANDAKRSQDVRLSPPALSAWHQEFTDAELERMQRLLESEDPEAVLHDSAVATSCTRCRISAFIGAVRRSGYFEAVVKRDDDSKRLDWLEKRTYITESAGSPPIIVQVEEHIPHGNLREAIDAAMIHDEQ